MSLHPRRFRPRSQREKLDRLQSLLGKTIVYTFTWPELPDETGGETVGEAKDAMKYIFEDFWWRSKHFNPYVDEDESSTFTIILDDIGGEVIFPFMLTEECPILFYPGEEWDEDPIINPACVPELPVA